MNSQNKLLISTPSRLFYYNKALVHLYMNHVTENMDHILYIFKLQLIFFRNRLIERNKYLQHNKNLITLGANVLFEGNHVQQFRLIP